METNPFRHLNHLSLKFVPASDVYLKKYLAECLLQLKVRIQFQNTKGEISCIFGITSEGSHYTAVCACACVHAGLAYTLFFFYCGKLKVHVCVYKGFQVHIVTGTPAVLLLVSMMEVGVDNAATALNNAFTMILLFIVVTFLLMLPQRV